MSDDSKFDINQIIFSYEMHDIMGTVRQLYREEVMKGIVIAWPTPLPVFNKDAITKLVATWEHKAKRCFWDVDASGRRNDSFGKERLESTAVFYHACVLELLKILDLDITSDLSTIPKGDQS